MGETRVDLLHLLEDLRDAYPGSTEETILTEIVANALDSGATGVTIVTDATAPALTIVDNGRGMKHRELARYHDIAASTKTRGAGIGFAASASRSRCSCAPRSSPRLGAAARTSPPRGIWRPVRKHPGTGRRRPDW